MKAEKQRAEPTKHEEAIRMGPSPPRYLEDSVMVEKLTYEELQQRVQKLEKCCDDCKIGEEDYLKAKKLESIAALSGGIAHDYNNLLTAIIGNISLAQTYLDPHDKASTLLGEAYAASMVAKDLTQKLITFSRGGAPIKKIASLHPLIHRATDFSLSGSNVKCEFQIPDNLWTVEVDENQIGQAIYNLVINAREAMPGGGALRVTAENVDTPAKGLGLENGRYVKISFKDRGEGISREILDRIFDPYFSTKEMGAEKGLGLGLSICHSIIQGHEGAVEVESQEGVGTTFRIYLPASEAEVPEAKAKKACINTPSVYAKGRILVMDDEKMIRDLAGELLARLGYEAGFASDGLEAIRLYKEARDTGNPFNAVVLDLTVRGGMGGKATIEKLLKIDPDVRGVVSSGYSDDPVMTDFGDYGFCGVVSKPYTLLELSETLNQVIGGGESI